MKARALEPASAFFHPASALCVLVIFGVVCPLSLFIFPYMTEDKHRRERASSQAVFFPAALLYGWGYTLCVLSAWEQNTQSQLSRELIARITRAFGTAYAFLSESSFEREPSPAFLAVPALLSPMRTCGCARRNRRQNHTSSRKTGLDTPPVFQEVDVGDVNELSKSILK